MSTLNFSRWLALQALEALLYELCATPKPGLVDRANNGSHRDMDFYTFLSSIQALSPYWERLANLGQEGVDLEPAALLERARPLGLEAQEAMFKATGGVNTHKGALFALGLASVAAGRLQAQGETLSPSSLGELMAAMSAGICQKELESLSPQQVATMSHGERMFLRHRATGARGQAQSGYRLVVEGALPYLRSLEEEGLGPDEVHVRALLWLISQLEDTNILARVGPQLARQVRQQAQQLSENYSLAEAQKLDRSFIALNISPGGSADLLSLAIFLNRLCFSPLPGVD